MRYRRQTVDNNVNEFIEDVESIVSENGVKNAILVTLGEHDQISVIALNDYESVQISGMLDLGKSVFHDNVLDSED